MHGLSCRTLPCSTTRHVACLLDTLPEAVEKLEWYALRLKIETFHKIMKPCCKADEARLRTAERLVKFLALVAVVSGRVFWLTMSARAQPDGDPSEVLTVSEITGLAAIEAARSTPKLKSRTLQAYLQQIARLGGYLARTREPPPLNHRHLARLHPPSRHHNRYANHQTAKLWVIERQAGRLLN